MIRLNYTIHNLFSGWFDDDSSYPEGVFSRSKSHRFFTAQDCFSNQEPFIQDDGSGYGGYPGPITFKEDWQKQEMKSYEFVKLYKVIKL